MTRRTESSRLTGIIRGVLFATYALVNACSPSDHTSEALVGVPNRPMEAKTPNVLPSVSFRQLDFKLDDGRHNNSPWGRAALTYLGVGGIVYFNLVVDGRWVVVNFPVTSPEGADVRQTLDFHFDLGSGDGKNVSQLKYAFALTEGRLATAPSNVARAHVEGQHYRDAHRRRRTSHHLFAAGRCRAHGRRGSGRQDDAEGLSQPGSVVSSSVLRWPRRTACSGSMRRRA